jgi:hypothetical protein
MGEREDFLHRRRQVYEQMRLSGRRHGPLARWRARRNLKRLVSARAFGPPGGWDDGDTGGAGVREPRRPLPRSPQGAAERPID